MSEHGVFYDVLAAQAEAIADSIPDDLPEHKFSLSFRRREKAALKAYERSQRKKQDFTGTYRKMQLWKRLRLVFIIVFTALFLTGASAVVIHYIAGLRLEQYRTHTNAFAVNTDNAPADLMNKYHITYDLSDYNCEVKCDQHNLYWGRYENQGSIINYILSTKEAFENARLTTENVEIESVNVNGYKGIFYTTYYEGIDTLIWDNGEYIFELYYTGISYDEAIKIAESIEVQHKYTITYDLSEYDKEIMSDDEVEYWVIYRNISKNRTITFRYMPKENYGNIRYNTEGSDIETKYINGHEVLYFVTQKGVHCLTWDSGDYIIDFDYAGISYDEAVEIIKSIETLEK